MGNFSCSQGGRRATSSSSGSSRSGYWAEAESGAIIPQAQVARVLLVGGGVLLYTRPVKVITLLLEYPQHVVCPLESMRPGHHSLPSLLPHEELRLGRLYLLLPFRAPKHHHHHHHQQQEEQQQQQQPCRVPDDPPVSSSLRHRRTSSSSPLGIHPRLPSAASCTTARLSAPPPHDDHPLYHNPYRLCDTPELQRAYRSAMLRRCRSWTPRLQAINEGIGSRRPAPGF